MGDGPNPCSDSTTHAFTVRTDPTNIHTTTKGNGGAVSFHLSDIYVFLASLFMEQRVSGRVQQPCLTPTPLHLHKLIS